uniref:Immunoglobulin V-set domain-containing protein n=1 Tax=Pygocentrus nattereri TaxID=42514 RepID=A0AAR2KBY4_PYGNA
RLLESALELLELDTEDSQSRLDAPIGLYKTSIKYLCRGECSALWRTKVIPVQSGYAEDQRFSLDDDTAARVFTITITDLRAEDGGRYWCGVKRPKPLPDLYTEILLLVEQGDPPAVSPSTYSPPSVQTQTTPLSRFPSTGMSSLLSLFFKFAYSSDHPSHH